MTTAYLDNAATTRIDPEALEAMMPYLDQQFANPSSIYEVGRASRKAIEDAREKIAQEINAKPQEILFTSCATEANNLAIFGLTRPQYDHLLVSKIEHESVLNPANVLSSEKISVKYISVDPSCQVDIESITEAAAKGGAFVSIMLVNNETGAIQPISKISKMTARKGILLHSDAVQALGKIQVDVKELDVDLLTLSAHKIHGPRGAGALYVREGITLRPMLHGGGQEFQKRSGTENTASIVGFAKACEIAQRDMDKNNIHLKSLRDRFIKGLSENINDITINSNDPCVPNIINVSFRGADGEAMIMALDQEKIFVSSGSACASLSMEPSHVLTAMGLGRDLVRSAIRFSLSRFTTEEEIDYTLKILPRVVKRLRSISPLYE